MNKELEALENLLSFAFVISENMVGLTKGNYDEKIFVKKTYEYLNKYIGNFECRDILKSALQRLEEIYNANPSEALKCFKRIGNLPVCVDYEKDIVKDVSELLPKSCDKVEKSLLKAQEMEKVLNIIKEKNIDIIFTKENITQEEIELVQRYCNEE